MLTVRGQQHCPFENVYAFETENVSIEADSNPQSVYPNE